MEKYKLINSVTKIETICDKVTIDGFDYYINNDKLIPNYYVFDPIGNRITKIHLVSKKGENFGAKKVIATNNPNIDIPKVVCNIDLTKLCYYDRRNPDFSIKEEYGYDKEEVEATGNFAKKDCACDNCFYGRSQLTEQLIKSQETHPFSEEDMIEFGQWVSRNDWVYLPSRERWVNEDREGLEQKLSSQVLLQIWKEERIKTLYYE